MFERTQICLTNIKYTLCKQQLIMQQKLTRQKTDIKIAIEEQEDLCEIFFFGLAMNDARISMRKRESESDVER